MGRRKTPDGQDWDRVGANVRQARIIRGDSQEELARRAGLSISTVYHVEQGRSISARSLQRIAAALYSSVDSIVNRTQNVLSDDTPLMQHRAAEGLWTAEVDPRAKVPEDNLQRIQDPQERRRLGRLGLVPWFLSTTGFIMPEGPGHVFMELYGRFGDSLNAMIYRDSTLACVQGRVRLSIAGRTAEMEEGDVVGYRSKDLEWIEPVPDSPLPARLTWTGAVRLGDRPEEGVRRVRRRRRTPEEG